MRPRHGLSKLFMKLSLTIAIIVGILIGTVLLPGLAQQAINLREDRPAPQRLAVLPATVGGVRVTAATMSPSGTVILGTTDGSIYIEKNPTLPLDGHPIHVSSQNIDSIISSEDAHTIAGIQEESSGGITKTSIWIWNNGLISTIPTSSLYPSITLSEDGKSLGVIRHLNDDPNGTFWQPVIYDLSKDKPNNSFHEYAQTPQLETVIGDPRFSPDGHSLGIPAGNEIYVLNLSTGEYSTPFSNCPCNNRAQISENWSIVANSFNSNYVEVWDLKNNKLLGADRIVPGGLGDHFAVNDKIAELVVQYDDPYPKSLTNIIVWDITFNRERARIHLTSTGESYPLTFSRDGHLLLVGADSIWRL